MKLEITKHLFNTFDNCVDVLVVAGAGNLSGRFVNYVVKLANPSVFPKPPYMDLTSATVICGVFISVYRLSRFIIAKFFSEENLDRISMSLIRVGISFSAAKLALESIHMFNAEIPILEDSVVAVALTAALLTYSLFKHCLSSINNG